MRARDFAGSSRRDKSRIKFKELRYYAVYRPGRVARPRGSQVKQNSAARSLDPAAPLRLNATAVSVPQYRVVR